jgi:hypothetical protein
MRAVFEWLDAHPGFYWIPAVGATLLLVGWILRGLRAGGHEKSFRHSGWVFASLLMLFLAAWRWPFLLSADEYNPDESQFIAGALTLSHDPVFWRSVVDTTSGPLNFYALLPLWGLGLPFDYFSARLTGLLLTTVTLLLLYRLFREKGGARAAYLAVLPGAMFFAAGAEPDFIHYSSELVSLALLALAILWVEQRPLAAALIAGVLPWAKLQALPLGAVLVLWQFGQAWRESGSWRRMPVRRWSQLAACALLPTLLIIGTAAGFGQFESLFRRYVLQNLVYVDHGMGRTELIRLFWARCNITGIFPLWTLSVLALLAGSVVAYLRTRRWPDRRFWLGLALLVTAVACVLAPGRPSLHYLLYLIVPIILMLGVSWAELWPARRTPVATTAVIILALLPLAWRVTLGVPEMFGQFSVHWRQPVSPLGSVLQYWRAPGARLAVWGWLNSAYVESGLPQATKDVLTVWSVHDTAERDYFWNDYLADLQRNQPVLFVDATGIGAPLLTDWTRQSHESYPALAAYVQQHYQLVVDLAPARVFVRTDVLAAKPITKRELQQRLDRGRWPEDYSPPAARILPPTAPGAEAHRQAVQMLEPPAEMLWHLSGIERVAIINYGFHPRAYTEGKSDGADLIAELRPPGEPPLEIFRHRIDPAQVPADRGQLRARVALPPFPAGTDLVVRTTPGATGDTAWDWVYVRNVAMLRSPYYFLEQFPGFTRRPDRVHSRYPSLVDRAGTRRLMLPPPSELVFEADGSERRLTLTYGLLPDAYEGAGQTDGVTYLIEWRSSGGQVRKIFEHRLDPLRRPADRGAQTAEVALPAGILPGDELRLQIEPGASDSWDWAYITALELR